jgi:hypothetical protein
MVGTAAGAAQQQAGGSDPALQALQALQQQVQQLQQALELQELQELKHKAEMLKVNSMLQTARCADSHLTVLWHHSHY